MGFLDDFVDGFHKGTEKESISSANRQSNSSYRNVRDEQTRLLNTFNSESDGNLLRKMKSSFTTNEEKNVIHRVLLSRGYTRVGDNYRKF